MKETAVDWLIGQLYAPCRGIPSHIIEQAKEMEKEQMVDFARNIIIDATCSVEGYVTTEKDIEDYYNETFKANEK
jgi:hypothetical protein